jgi:tetratricopeptide (TPR) repeat protein
LLLDGLTFLGLLGISVGLFGITLFLFRSFEHRREEIGQRWSERGAKALQEGDANYAVQALRTALTYAPNDHDAQLQLAHALVVSGRTDEAMNYFLNLWEVHPGDGYVNLELARLASKKGHVDDAINYYRAAVFGNWNGDGVERRREIRLELENYYISRGNLDAAKTVLLTVSGNNAETPDIQLDLGERMEAIGDMKDALATYQKLLPYDPHDRNALAHAGRAAYALADYPLAATLLTRALAEPHEPPPAGKPDLAEQQSLEILASSARRLQELNLSRELPAQQRAEHLVRASGIAERHLEACIAHVGTPAIEGTAAAAVPAPLAALQQRWSALRAGIDPRTLPHDSDAADKLTALVNDTELQTPLLCGQPTGDDALLLRLANAGNGGAR